MTTPMRMTPWATTARFVLTLRNVMSVRISWQDDDGDDRAEDAAPTTGQAHAAKDDRRHAQQRVAARAPASPMPVLAVSARPPSAANSPVSA